MLQLATPTVLQANGRAGRGPPEPPAHGAQRAPNPKTCAPGAAVASVCRGAWLRVWHARRNRIAIGAAGRVYRPETVIAWRVGTASGSANAKAQAAARPPVAPHDSASATGFAATLIAKISTHSQDLDTPPILAMRRTPARSACKYQIFVDRDVRVQEIELHKTCWYASTGRL